jgi:hypothetical protein
MSDKCTWAVDGVVQQVVMEYDKFGREHWRVTLGLEVNAVTLFIHEATLFPLVRSLSRGVRVSASGEIIPKIGEHQNPHFLNPLHLIRTK